MSLVNDLVLIKLGALTTSSSVEWFSILSLAAAVEDIAECTSDRKHPAINSHALDNVSVPESFGNGDESSLYERAKQPLMHVQ